MATANPYWGARRLHGEQLKLGIEISERTVSRLIPKDRKPPSQTWKAFLNNHLKELISIVSPNKTAALRSYEGWAYAARTPDKNIFLAYFENGSPRSQIRGARLNSTYRAQWFDPRDGSWQNVGDGTVRASVIGIITLPDLPGGNDWGLRLAYEGPSFEQRSDRANNSRR